jgi:branched-chain amino acid transport system permease protein
MPSRRALFAGEAGLRNGAMLALALVPLAAAWLGQPFYVELVTRIMVFAIAAVSLNFILGFGGMVSFGHAAFLGLGAYAVGIAIDAGILNGFVHLALVLAVTGLAALVIGAICLRTSGLYFIMITLAFAQLLYFVGVGLKPYGGDDGFTFRGRSVFAAWLDLRDDTIFYYLVWAVLALSLLLAYRFVNSRFGMALRGIRSNERRMRALGLPTYRYRLAAFVIAGTMCGVAGGLLANLTQFVSPAYMHWTRSGELLIMVIMGGLSSVFGPVLGATAYLLLEEVLSGYSEHWQLALGPILILVVLFGKSGLAGMLARPARPAESGRHG